MPTPNPPDLPADPTPFPLYNLPSENWFKITPCPLFLSFVEGWRKPREHLREVPGAVDAQEPCEFTGQGGVANFPGMERCAVIGSSQDCGRRFSSFFFFPQFEQHTGDASAFDARQQERPRPAFRTPAGPRNRPEPYSLSWARAARQAPVPLQFSASSEVGASILNHVTQYGINETRYLTAVKEPKLFEEGYHLQRGHPGLFLAAFNKQKKKSKTLAEFGYASLRASELLFLLTRQQALFGLEQVSLRNTALYDACPVKTEEFSERPCPAYSVMYRTLDGTCNNLDKQEWGAAFRPFARFLPPDYSDGIEALRESVREGALPNPRKISATVHRSLNRPSYKITMMVMQWGQFLDHDITATAQSRGFNHSVPRCCNERTGKPLPEAFRHPDCLPIEIPDSDPFYSKWNHTCMEFVRSSPAPRANCALGPRDQINQVTSYIDASNVYGSDDHEMAQLRLWEAAGVVGHIVNLDPQSFQPESFFCGSDTRPFPRRTPREQPSPRGQCQASASQEKTSARCRAPCLRDC
ncbi:hypothetical protein C7M84_012292 [Penaeus vannamei]|uniref:Chorion peroxidase n=1 Tax=Penaeus vannamei TaxID=6689 RepID=A0A3R7MTP1_PENVA|nr:hypothetical protein C7M84_012292 [Penaeus vannamei]